MRILLRCHWALGLALMFGMTGCQVSRTMFQMDSNNRAPSIGLDLAPKPKSDQPVRPIVHDEAQEVHPEVIASAANQEPGERSWLKWLNPLNRPKHIPLPRTDLAEDEEMVEVESGEIGNISDDF